MPLVHERARDRAWSGVQIFVGAPNGEIDIPIVKRERNVADGVGKIESGNGTVLLRGCCDFLNVDQLACEKVDCTDHYDRELIGVFLDQIDNVFRTNGELAFAWARENKRIFGIEPMMCDLRFDRVGIGRECGFFHQDFEPRMLSGSIKRGHHEMEIHREAVHADDLDWLRSDESRHRFAQRLMIRIPRCPSRVMCVYAKRGPVVQLLVDDLPRRFRH